MVAVPELCPARHEIAVSRVIHEPVEFLHAPAVHFEHQMDAGRQEVPHVIRHARIIRHDRESVHLLLGDDIERGRAFVRQLVKGIEFRAKGPVVAPFPREIDVEIVGIRNGENLVPLGAGTREGAVRIEHPDAAFFPVGEPVGKELAQVAFAGLRFAGDIDGGIECLIADLRFEFPKQKAGKPLVLARHIGKIAGGIPGVAPERVAVTDVVGSSWPPLLLL